MTVATLVLYLLGSETAIRVVAQSAWSIGIGLIFVLSAGIARSYRKHDLRRRPAILLLPLAASLGTSLCFYVLVWGVMGLGGANLFNPPREGFQIALGTWWNGYAAFLGLFWMTAPLAWLYGIPFERWTTRTQAVKVRLWCLAIVSLWRMALMMRVLVILLDCRTSAAVFLVMFFGDLVALTALFLTASRDVDESPQILTGMGGIGPTVPAGVRLLQSVRAWVLGLGILTAPMWLIGTLNAIGSSRSWSPLPQMAFDGSLPGTGLLALAAGSLFAWSLALIPAQKRQGLRTRIESLAENGEWELALAEISAKAPNDFPAHWSPPPGGRIFRSSDQEMLLRVLERLPDAQPAPWVRTAYLEQFRDYLDQAMWYWFDEAALTRLSELLPRFSEGPLLAHRAAKGIDLLLEQSARFAYPVRDEDKDQTPPFPVSENLPNHEVWSLPDWPRDTMERRTALNRIRALAAESGNNLSPQEGSA